MTDTADTDHSDPRSGLGVGAAQCGPDRVAGADSGGRHLVGESVGKKNGAVFVHGDVLGLTAIDIDTGQDRCDAVVRSDEAVYMPLSAEITSSTRPLCDGQSDSIADFASGHSLTEGNDLTHALVPEHHGELANFDRASSEQRVGVAHSARMDLDEDLLGPRLRHGYVLQHPRAVHLAHDSSFHRCHSRSSCSL